MMNLRENNTYNTLFVILDRDLKLAYFNKLHRSIVEDIIKALEIENLIKQDDVRHKKIKKFNISINKCIANKDYIFIIEIKFDNNMSFREVLADENQNDNVKSLKSDESEYPKIKNEMERLKDKLNLLMEDNYRNNYDRVLEVSMQLDDVINRYCMLVKDN